MLQNLFGLRFKYFGFGRINPPHTPLSSINQAFFFFICWEPKPKRLEAKRQKNFGKENKIASFLIYSLIYSENGDVDFYLLVVLYLLSGKERTGSLIF